jgi:hypothetical protein
MQAQYLTTEPMNALLAYLSRQAQVRERVRSTKPQTLQIVQATYGAGELQMDVTQQVQTAIASGQTCICPSNGLFGTDPAPGKMKRFSVSFVEGGNLYEMTVREGEQVCFAALERIIGSSWSAS